MKEIVGHARALFGCIPSCHLATGVPGPRPQNICSRSKSWFKTTEPFVIAVHCEGVGILREMVKRSDQNFKFFSHQSRFFFVMVRVIGAIILKKYYDLITTTVTQIRVTTSHHHNFINSSEVRWTQDTTEEMGQAEDTKVHVTI